MKLVTSYMGLLCMHVRKLGIDLVGMYELSS